MKAFLKQLVLRVQIITELLYFFWKNKLWWGIPVIITILIIMTTLIFGQATGLAPFIYPLF